jgi:glutamate racemase
VTLHDALRKLAAESKISQHARDDVIDLIEESDQAQIDADLDEIRNIVENNVDAVDSLADRIERIEAELDIRNNHENDQETGE